MCLIKHPKSCQQRKILVQSVAPTHANTAAVIVTYYPDPGFADRLGRVIPQVSRVIVVDNSSKPCVTEWLDDAASSHVEITTNAQNVGLASALNQGVRRATALGCAWALTLDQDTLVDDDIVERLIEIYRRCSVSEKVGVIGSNARSKGSGRLLIQCRQGAEPFIEAKTVITSGSLVSVPICQDIGPFREDFFIEGIDLEYCLRVRRQGYAVLCSCRPLITQIFGKGQERRFFGRVVVVDNHEPWRYYYRLRNFVHILRSYFWQEPWWSLETLISYAKMLIKIALYETSRFAKFGAVARGIRDGIVNEKSASYCISRG